MQSHVMAILMSWFGFADFSKSLGKIALTSLGFLIFFKILSERGGVGESSLGFLIFFKILSKRGGVGESPPPQMGLKNYKFYKRVFG